MGKKKTNQKTTNPPTSQASVTKERHRRSSRYIISDLRHVAYLNAVVDLFVSMNHFEKDPKFKDYADSKDALRRVSHLTNELSGIEKTIVQKIRDQKALTKTETKALTFAMEQRIMEIEAKTGEYHKSLQDAHELIFKMTKGASKK